ncbi:hypothetical protein G9A89_006342 [Geosiphon pyriformis]|nr:hypothetical protein G9A89_006342 [Geosiphon pyriformis]
MQYPELCNIQNNKFKVATASDITILEKHFFNTSKIESTTTSLGTITLQHGNKRQKDNRPVHTTPNTPKISFKHLQTPEQGTSSKLPLTITPFPASLAQAQTPNSPLNQFVRPEDFTSLRNPTRQQEPLQTSSNLLDFLAENQSEHSETAANEENNSEITEEESIDSENEEDKMTTYIAKIPDFNGEDIETSPQEWLDQVTKAGDANGWNTTRMLRTIPYFLKETAEEWFENLATLFNNWNAFKAAFLEQFTDNNTSITLRNCFRNIKQKPSESVMTYIGKFNKLLRWICQLETNDYYSDVCPHVPEDLNSAIQHAKRYKMAMEEANRTKLVNLAIGETSSAAEEKIDQLTKKVENYFTNQQQQQPQRYQPPQRRNQNNFAPLSNNQPQNCHYCEISGHWKRNCRKLQQDQQNRGNQHYSPPQQSYYQPSPPAYYPPRPQYQNNYYQPASQPIQQQYQQPPTQHYQVPARRLITQNQFTPQNRYQVNNSRISSNNQLVPQNTTQPRPNHYHTQPSYLTMPEEQDFHHTALLEGRAAAQQQQNPFHNHTTILPAQIAENANLSDIFPFEFEANESPFLLSNAVANKQKAITAMYTEAELMQQLKRNVDRPVQTVIVTADGMKKTSVGEIDNFPFILDGITIPVKVLVMDAPQYQALIRNNWLQKANANLNWETQKLTISYQGQHVWVPAICGTFNKRSEKAPAFEFEPEEEKPILKTFMALGSMSNWADETEQEHFTPHTKPKTSGWNISYSKPEPRKQHPYISLKCKNCHKKLSSMGACILPEEEYENHTCYYCKACHKEQWGHLIKKSGKWDNTPCLTCEDMLLEECNWIDVAMRGGICDQTCQYALSISEKVKRGTPFNAAYNSAFNKLYHYSHDAKMIFDLAMALINGATKENVCQIKEAEYIEYIMELAGFDYEDEVEVYHQIASHTYLTQEAQIQKLEQMNIRLYEECIMLCDEQWCSECYALSIPLPSENNENEIEFGEPEEMEKNKTTPIYLIENQPALQLKYFNNNGQGIKPEKAHKIDAGYDLRYPGKDTLVLKPKSLTKINLKITLEILPGAIVQIASRSSLASKGINVKGGIIDARYTGDITVMLQNETDKPFKIEHAEKIVQAIYLPLINISDLQLVNQREQLGKSNRETQALNTQNEFHQILRLLQPITISPFREHPGIYTCTKPTTTQQIFESNEQVCLEHNILIPNIYISEGTKKVRVTFYNPNNYPIILLNNLEIGVIHSNIFQQKLPQIIPNFSEIIGHSIPKTNPNPSSENYHVVMEKLSRINMEQLEPQQQTQLKELIAEFADIFTENNNDLERTDLVQHQIYTEDAKPRRQQAY